MLFAVRRHFLCTSPRAHRLCAAWINCGSGSEKVLRVIETGIGGSGVGICTAACDGAVNGRGWRGGNGALTPLSLLRLKTQQPLTHRFPTAAGIDAPVRHTRTGSSINHIAQTFWLWFCLEGIFYAVLIKTYFCFRLSLEMPVLAAVPPLVLLRMY